MARDYEVAAEIAKAVEAALHAGGMQAVTGVLHYPIPGTVVVACGEDPAETFYVGVYRLDPEEGRHALKEIADRRRAGGRT
jgi:hypothetical protein